MPWKAFNSQTKSETKCSKTSRNVPKIFKALFSCLKVFHRHLFTVLHPQFQGQSQKCFTARICRHGQAENVKIFAPKGWSCMQALYSLRGKHLLRTFGCVSLCPKDLENSHMFSMCLSIACSQMAECGQGCYCSIRCRDAGQATALVLYVALPGVVLTRWPSLNWKL